MNKKLILLLLSFFSLGIYAQSTSDVKIEELTEKSFKTKVWNFDKNSKFTREGSLPIILDFHATWCPPCKKLAPHLQEIQNKYKDKLIVYKIDVDQEPELARKFNIKAMPTIVFINDLKSYKSEVGYRTLDEFEQLTKNYFFQK